MSIYSQTIKKIIIPIADVLMKTSVAANYRKIKLMQTWSALEIDQWQNEQLSKLIKHAYTQTEYYKKIFIDLGLTPNDIKSRKDLCKLPVLTKKDIRNNYNDLIPKNIDTIPHKKASTGGSTGDPLVYLLDNRSWSFSNANNIFNWERTGYQYGEKYIALGSSSLFVENKRSIKHRLYYRLKSKIGLNGINMSDDVCSNYVSLFQSKNIRFIYGYASAIYLLAKYVINNNVSLDIHACLPTSEVLNDHYRETIQKAFQSKIVDCYGAHDGGISAYSFEPGFFEVGYNSIVRLFEPDNNGLGSALLTDTFNFAMPLINYQLGDELQIDDIKNTHFSYNGQIINQVLGRTSDIIQLENGNVLTGPGFTILFKDIPVEYYFIEKNGINAITCSIKKLSGYNDNHERIILSTFKNQMGSNSRISIKYSNDIQLTKSGKRKYFGD